MAASTTSENVCDLIVGTYEEFLLGYSLEKNGKRDFSLRQTFTNHSHLGSVRCVASGGRFVASGSTDETVRLFNMRNHTEMGTLMQHGGTITDVQFYKSSHLFSTSEDKTICVWNTGSWQCLKTLRGHKGEVSSIAVHPSGKLLLSVSKDKSLRTWNLVKGRNAYITNIKAVADFIGWSPSGDHFVVGVGSSLDVYNTEKAGKVYSIDFGKRLVCTTFMTDEVILLGGDGGTVEMHNIARKSVYHMFTAHENRVKALQVVRVLGKILLASASSDGSVRVWRLKEKKLDADPTLLCETNCGCRITCMTVHLPELEEEKPKKRKRKRKTEADDDGESRAGRQENGDAGDGQPGTGDEAHEVDANEDVADDDNAGDDNDSVAGNDDKKVEGEGSEDDPEGNDKVEDVKPKSKREKRVGNDKKTKVEGSEDDCEESNQAKDPKPKFKRKKRAGSNKKTEVEGSEDECNESNEVEDPKPKSKRKKCAGNNKKTEVEGSEDECKESNQVEDPKPKSKRRKRAGGSHDKKTEVEGECEESNKVEDPKQNSKQRKRAGR